jgi:hypothetical protein
MRMVERRILMMLIRKVPKMTILSFLLLYMIREILSIGD